MPVQGCRFTLAVCVVLYCYHASIKGLFNDSDLQLSYGNLKNTQRIFLKKLLQNRRLFGCSRGKRSDRFCGDECAVLMELEHRFEMNRAEIPICTANFLILYCITVIPRLTKIIRSGITFVSRNVICRRFL